MEFSFGGLAEKIGKSRGKITTIYKIVDLILRCSAGGTLTPEVIQKARKELTGLSRGILEDLAYITEEEHFKEALSLAKSGATRGELRLFIEKKKEEEKGGEARQEELKKRTKRLSTSYTPHGVIKYEDQSIELETVHQIGEVLKEVREK